MVEAVLVNWSSSSPNGRRNLEHGIQTLTWGYRQFEEDYRKHSRYMLFGYNHSGGSPRKDASSWQKGTVSLVLCELTDPLYRAHAPHWPDELALRKIIYACRFGITPIGSAHRIPTAADGPLGVDGSNALRRSAIGNRGYRIHMDVAPLLAIMGIPDTGTSPTDMSRTMGALFPDLPAVRGRRGAGRSQDPDLRVAVKNHALDMATRHFLSLGWDKVERLGKPYSLVCTKSNGDEKHVEVKGTTGAGSNVTYTLNEVYHFRTCPLGADLVVVRDIAVDRTAKPYIATGGELRHIPNYRAPIEDLQPTGWLGRVNGW